MRTAILMVLFTTFSLVVFAQEKKQPKLFGDKKQLEELRKDSSFQFDISPKFREQLPFEKFKDTTLSWDSDKYNDGKFYLDSTYSEAILAPMPIAGSRTIRNYHNMPIAVPDSSVEYYIKEKRINIINPLEYNEFRYPNHPESNQKNGSNPSKK